MSYDLYFLKSKKPTLDNIDEFLAEDASESDEHFISSVLMKEISATLEEKGLKFESFEGKEGDYLELNFDTFQVSMFHSQIAISLPYWDVNRSDAVNKQVKLISNVLFERGFTGCDPQTSRLFADSDAFSTEFAQTHKSVAEHLAKSVNSNEPSRIRRLVKFGAIFLLAVILMRVLISIVGKML